MEIRPGILRTPDHCFAGLPGYDFPPHYVEIADPQLGALRMHYIDEGDPAAPVVLMLHGNPTWSYLYRHMIGPVVSAGYRVIAPDMIGFGRSDKPASRTDYGFDRFVAWMQAFVETVDLQGATLVCQDWGGPIGLRVVAQSPDRFAAILATNTLLQNCDPPPLGVPGWPGEAIAAWVETCRTAEDLPLDLLVGRACATDVAEAVLAAYAAPFPDARYKKGMLQITCGIPIAEGAEGLEANRAAWRFLETWDKPFLTAFSDQDPATIAWEEVFQRRIPGAQGQPHARIAGGGHFVQEDRGAALAEVLIAFLNANRRL
ncbi:haloalkane dehalogenase [Sphingobium sp.]|uniref:haloalkane dehalogenase n=1 Tax=Sphingobium sp. TaxID=1912891 RepID=UPI0035C78720